MPLPNRFLFALTLTGFAFTSAFSAVPQLILPEEVLTHYVDEPVSVQLEADGPVDSYTVKGLPPGLTINEDGLITGHPKKGLPLDSKTGQLKPYRVAITPSNVEGKGNTAYLDWFIEPILAPGYYEGLIDSVQEIVGDEEKNGLGSLIKLTATSSGTFSGQILYEGKTYRIATIPTFVERGGPIPYHYVTIRFSISLGRGKPTINFSLDVTDDDDNIVVTQDDEFLAYGLLNRAAFSSKFPADNYVSSYTWNLSLDAPPDLPSLYGTGYATCSISKTGLIRWKGKLADGTALIGSSSMLVVKNEDYYTFPIYKMLYKGTGSIRGWVKILPPIADPSPVRFFSDDLLWEKFPRPETSKDRNQKEGIPLQSVILEGSTYTPPAKGLFVIDFGANSDNAHLGLFSPYVTNEEIQQSFTLTDKHKLSTPIVVDAEHPLKSLRIDLRQGLFSGTVILTDENFDDEFRPIKRTATFQGSLLQSKNSGGGYMLLPDLSDGETPLKNSPINSVLVNLKPNNP